MLIEAKTCPICQCQFTPMRRARGVQTQHCGLRCSRKAQALALKGKTPTKAVLAVKAKRDQELRAALRGTFDELSVRDIELFRFAYRTAYNRGYLKGYHAMTKRKTAEAA